MNLLTKLKDPRTNWKYILIVIVLASIVGGGILWLESRVTKEMVSLTQVPEIRKQGETINPKEREERLHEEEQKLLGEYGGKSYEEVIYRNQKFGFEFRYPKTYAEDHWARAREEDDFVSVGALIELGIFDSNGLTLNEYVTRYLDEEDIEVEYEENVVVSDEKAISISYHFGGLGRYGEDIFALHNGKIYIFNMTAGGESSVALQKGPGEWAVFSRIIESFRFLDER
jgi:hypothetical protein